MKIQFRIYDSFNRVYSNAYIIPYNGKITESFLREKCAELFPELIQGSIYSVYNGYIIAVDGFTDIDISFIT